MLIIGLILFFALLTIYSCYKIYKIIKTIELTHSDYNKGIIYMLLSSIALFIPLMLHFHGNIPAYVVAICVANNWACILLAAILAIKYDSSKNFAK